MTSMALEAFDTLASRYDELWTRSAVGRSQRAAVWRHVDPLFKEGDSVLDLGCGTGEDALHLSRLGIRVRGLDKSEQMVRMARERGVDAGVLPMERICELREQFDGAISNFGAMNCVSSLESLREPLARLVRPGGHLAICVMGCFCPWETVWYLAHGRPRKAFRRWSGQSHSPSIGIPVYYPSAQATVNAFSPNFELNYWTGIGLFVPPSYVGGATSRLVARLETIDRRLAHLPLLRASADHRLFVFRRK
jgi:ubiquinone/menaquinone biosynthesis C-methylase UbiE